MFKLKQSSLSFDLTYLSVQVKVMISLLNDTKFSFHSDFKELTFKKNQVGNHL